MVVLRSGEGEVELDAAWEAWSLDEGGGSVCVVDVKGCVSSTSFILGMVDGCCSVFASCVFSDVFSLGELWCQICGEIHAGGDWCPQLYSCVSVCLITHIMSFSQKPVGIASDDHHKVDHSG